MRVPFLPTLAAIAVGTVAAAHAAPMNLVQNGSFEQTSLTSSSEFGASYGGQTVANWTSPSASAFNVYFFANTATTVSAANRFNDPGNKLDTAFTGPSPDGGNFVALDGDTQYNGPLNQTINGLVVGDHYALTFDWGAIQLQNRTGATTEQIQASLGGSTKLTSVVNNPSQGFSGWLTQTFIFTATSGSEVLSFLSLGTPNGLPPMALLDGVSLTDVPEPATLSLFGMGVLGLTAAIRRARRA
jgi:hypothetical protein